MIYKTTIVILKQYINCTSTYFEIQAVPRAFNTTFFKMGCCNLNYVICQATHTRFVMEEGEIVRCWDTNPGEEAP